jgi:DbpA RNA binding domain
MIAEQPQEDTLIASLRRILSKHNLDKQRQQIQHIAETLGVSPLDCAAALIYQRLGKKAQTQTNKTNPTLPISAPDKIPCRNVRYRLDVGSQHQINRDQIQNLLIAESGVDKKRIGRIDIRPDHTIVELPDGMPADIFQILSEASLGNRKLALKRIKGKRKPQTKTRD